MALFGNQTWQSNGRYGEDSDRSGGLEAQLRTTAADGQDALDEPDGPPEAATAIGSLEQKLHHHAAVTPSVDILREGLSVGRSPSWIDRSGWCPVKRVLAVPLLDVPGPLHLYTRALGPTRRSRSVVGIEPEVDGKGDSSEGNEHAQGARGGMPDDDWADARSD